MPSGERTGARFVIGLPLRIAIAVSALAAAAGAGSAPETTASGPPVSAPEVCAYVRSLSFERHNIYREDEPERSNFYAGWANSLHIRTREGVLRRGLHFRQGDCIRADDVGASIRRLRSYPFLHSNITIDGFTGADSVDLVVHTRDVWTTRAEFQFRKEGEFLTWALGLRESNLLGTGKELAIGIGEDEVQTFWSAGYRDFQFLGTGLRTTLFIAEGSERRATSFALRQPFERATTPWGLEIRLEDFSGTLIDRRGGLDGPEWDLDYRELTVAAGPRVLGSPGSALWLMPGFHLRSETYRSPAELAGAGSGEESDRVADGCESITDCPLANREIRAPGLLLRWMRERFVQRSGINAFEHHEDFNLGTFVSLMLAYSARDLEGDVDGPFGELVAEQGVPMGARQFALLDLTVRGQLVAGTLRDARVLTMSRYYNQLSRRHTLAARLRWDWGRNLLPQSVFTMGAESGLRGFEAFAFWGERVLLTSLEDRVMIVEDFMGLISLGVVGFLDAGVAWKAGERERERPRVAGGVGLRILGSRTSGRFVTRVDVGYPLLGGTSESDAILSIGAGQAF